MTEIEILAKISAEQDKAEKIEAQLVTDGMRDGRRKILGRQLKKVRDRIATLVKTKAS